MVSVNKKKCTGCGTCVSLCGKCFGLKGDKAYVKKQCNDPCVKEAAENCPAGAISA